MLSSSSVFSCTIMMLLLSHSSLGSRAKLLVWTRDFQRVCVCLCVCIALTILPYSLTIQLYSWLMLDAVQTSLVTGPGWIPASSQ